MLSLWRRNFILRQRCKKAAGIVLVACSLHDPGCLDVDDGNDGDGEGYTVTAVFAPKFQLSLSQSVLCLFVFSFFFFSADLHPASQSNNVSLVSLQLCPRSSPRPNFLSTFRHSQSCPLTQCPFSPHFNPTSLHALSRYPNAYVRLASSLCQIRTNTVPLRSQCGARGYIPPPPRHACKSQLASFAHTKLQRGTTACSTLV